MAYLGQFGKGPPSTYCGRPTSQHTNRFERLSPLRFALRSVTLDRVMPGGHTAERADGHVKKAPLPEKRRKAPGFSRGDVRRTKTGPGELAVASRLRLWSVPA